MEQTGLSIFKFEASLFWTIELLKSFDYETPIYQNSILTKYFM